MSELQAGLFEQHDEGDEELREEQHEESTEQQAEETSEEKGETSEQEQQETAERTVRLEALHEERMRRKELQQEVQSQRELMARMEERFKSLTERLDAKPEPDAPSYDEDPAGYLKHQTDQLQNSVADFKSAQQQAKEQQEQNAQLEAFRARFSATEEAFAEKHPDYYDAIAHLRSAISTELASWGYPPEQIQNAIQWEAHQRAHTAMQHGLDPAEAFYNMAKGRGYKPAAKQESEVEKLKTVEKGQKRSQSMGPSGSGNEEMTLARLAELSDDEFEKATSGDRWKALWH